MTPEPRAPEQPAAERRLGQPSARLLRGYGPLLAFAVLFVLMAAFVPSVGDQVRTVTVTDDTGATAGDAGGAGDEGSLDATDPGTSGDSPGGPGVSRTAPRTAGTGRNRAGTGPGSGSQAAARRGTAPTGGGRAPATGLATRTAAVGPCAGRRAQVPNDPYSPPCTTFAGDNGGATSRGVSSDTVVVSARFGGLPDFSQAPGDSGPGATFRIDPEEIKRTMLALTDYFNSRFQFYGRKLKLEFFEGKGDYITELQGGGQEQVEADAIKAAEEIKPFAEILGMTAPYADALARRGIVNFGAPYMSAEWMRERRPHVWSAATDCTFIQETVSDYVNKRVARRPAVHAGGALKGKPRTIAVIAPENPWYQECVDAGERVAKAAGNPNQARIAYKLDFGTLSNQAASVIAKLRSENITTVICGCDPAFPIFLTSKAEEQGYQPEWIITGAAFVDVDVLGQLYQQDQWSRSFGVSFLGPMQPRRASFGYHAFKAVRPNEEPSNFVDILYYQMYLLAVGVQMAGPNLTPETLERGMYAYPGGSGPVGTWGFTPGRYTPTLDAREIYWDRNRTSAQNGEQGAYVDTQPGKRYRPGEFPTTDPAIPER